MQDNALMETIGGQLGESADLEYREFHNKLLPEITGVMGVRTPQLRGLSEQLIKDGWQEHMKQVFLAWKQTDQGERGVYYDEMIPWGLCICGGFKDRDRAPSYIEEFAPATNNWAACDIFYSPLKVAGKYGQESWEFIHLYLRSDKKYEVRLAVVMMLSYLVDEDYVEAGSEPMDHIYHWGYYVKTVVAWAISIYSIKFPEPVMPCLKHNHLDDWMFDKTLRKITEPCHMDGEIKAVIRVMKQPVSRG